MPDLKNLLVCQGMHTLRAADIVKMSKTGLAPGGATPGVHCARCCHHQCVFAPSGHLRHGLGVGFHDQGALHRNIATHQLLMEGQCRHKATSFQATSLCCI